MNRNEIRIRAWLLWFRLKAMFSLPTLKAYVEYCKILRMVIE